MPLDGFRWSCDSDSALCDIPQTNVLGQAGGYFITIFAIEKSCIVTTRDIRRPCAPSMLAEQE